MNVCTKMNSIPSNSCQDQSGTLTKVTILDLLDKVYDSQQIFFQEMMEPQDDSADPSYNPTL